MALEALGMVETRGLVAAIALCILLLQQKRLRYIPRDLSRIQVQCTCDISQRRLQHEHERGCCKTYFGAV